MFPRDHFQLILAVFHKVENKNLSAPGEPGYGPFAKFQPVVEHASRILRHRDTPHQQLSVVERLVGPNNHTQFLQYFPTTFPTTTVTVIAV